MSKNNLTLEKKLHKRHIKKPPFLIYNLLGLIWKLLFMKKYNVNTEFKYDFRKEKGPYIVISNHASRLDYIFTGIPLLPNRLNYVAGYNEFFRSHLKGVFKILNVIPKKNFTADIYTFIFSHLFIVSPCLPPCAGSARARFYFFFLFSVSILFFCLTT